VRGDAFRVQVEKIIELFEREKARAKDNRAA